MSTADQTERRAGLLHAANRERLAGCHQLADAFMWLFTVDTEPALPRPASSDVQHRRQAKKESFSASPFSP